MKIYTQAEYDAIERDEFGIKRLPEGDYTQVVLDNRRHAIDARCDFGAGCKFDDECDFGDGCKVGDGCGFGDWCEFGQFFTHGKNTSFEGGAVKNGTFIKVGRIGSETRDAYFFIDENGKFFVRAGCWFSDMDSFIKHVHHVYKGARYERQYLAACEYAKAVLPEMLGEVNNG